MNTLRIGMILPSSNTVVEPECIRLAAALPPGLPPVSVHFARFALTAVQVANPAAAYYDSGALLGAAKLLADARCHLICWNGSAGGLVGFGRDRQLCAEILEATGIPATTSSLALAAQFARTGVKHFAMVTLNTPAMNRTIAATFAAEGFTCVASTERDDIADNFAMARIEPQEVAAMATRCIEGAPTRPDALIIYGTNTRGAPVARSLRERLGMPVYDSVAWGLYGALADLGHDTATFA
jgi:maleate isomerase